MVGIWSIYQSNLGLKHWIVVKHILNYLIRMRNYILIFKNDKLVPRGYTDSNFWSDKDPCQSTSSFIFTVGSVLASWRSVNQSCILGSTMKVEYIIAFEIKKEVVWIRKFLMELRVLLFAIQLMILFCDNSGAMTQSKEQETTKG